MAKSSPLSRWMGQSVLKQLRFQLSFDDPRTPEEERFTIQGDRDQLEALYEVVTTYVQNLINQSPERLSALLSAPSPSSSDPAVSSHPKLLELSADDFQGSDEDAQPPEEPAPNSARPNSELLPRQQTRLQTGEISLQPGPGLTHELSLGSLANAETGPVLALSTLQLFDLATALDEYAADVVALPNLNRPRLATSPPVLVGIAAIALASVGLTATVVRILQSRQNQEIATTTAPQPQASSSNTPQALQPSPSVSPTLSITPSPTLTPPDQLPTLPPSLTGTLPSPSPGSSAPPVITVPQTTTSNIPTAPGVILPQPSPVTPDRSGTSSPYAYPVSPLGPGKSGQQVVINPPSSQSGSTFTRTTPSSGTNRTRTPSSSGSGASSVPPIPPPLPDISPAPTSLPEISSTPTTLPSAATNSNTAGESSSKETPSASASPGLVESLRATRQPSASRTPTGDKLKNTADNTPQAAEARNYFKQRWQPPEGLTQNLEYSLIVDVDGTIQRIIPLGQASRKYVDRSGLPLVGEPFVSPNANGQPAKLRVLLSPDGKVQAFAE